MYWDLNDYVNLIVLFENDSWHGYWLVIAGGVTRGFSQRERKLHQLKFTAFFCQFLAYKRNVFSQIQYALFFFSVIFRWRPQNTLGFGCFSFLKISDNFFALIVCSRPEIRCGWRAHFLEERGGEHIWRNLERGQTSPPCQLRHGE